MSDIKPLCCHSFHYHALCIGALGVSMVLIPRSQLHTSNKHSTSRRCAIANLSQMYFSPKTTASSLSYTNSISRKTVFQVVVVNRCGLSFDFLLRIITFVLAKVSLGALNKQQWQKGKFSPGKHSPYKIPQIHWWHCDVPSAVRQ